ALHPLCLAGLLLLSSTTQTRCYKGIWTLEKRMVNAPALLQTPKLLPGLIFNRQLLKMRRNRAAASFSDHAFLKERVAHDLNSRLKLIHRTFQCCVDLGGHTGHLGALLKR